MEKYPRTLQYVDEDTVLSEATVYLCKHHICLPTCETIHPCAPSTSLCPAFCYSSLLLLDRINVQERSGPRASSSPGSLTLQSQGRKSAPAGCSRTPPAKRSASCPLSCPGIPALRFPASPQLPNDKFINHIEESLVDFL